MHIIPLERKDYEFFELHYTYTSYEHYVPSIVSEKNRFSCEFLREPLKKPYCHDSYDTLFDDSFPDCQAFGVEKDGQLVAFLGLYREEWNDRLRITNLLVLPHHRGCGIGKMLIDFVKQTAQNEDRRIITLETQSCNTPAIDFYLSCGFVFSGTNFYFYSNVDADEDEVMLELAYLY